MNFVTPFFRISIIKYRIGSNIFFKLFLTYGLLRKAYLEKSLAICWHFNEKILEANQEDILRMVSIIGLSSWNITIIIVINAHVKISLFVKNCEDTF